MVVSDAAEPSRFSDRFEFPPTGEGGCFPPNELNRYGEAYHTPSITLSTKSSKADYCGTLARVATQSASCTAAGSPPKSGLGRGPKVTGKMVQARLLNLWISECPSAKAKPPAPS